MSRLGCAAADKDGSMTFAPVMLRRLKREVMGQLPPKRRQVVRLPQPAREDWPPGHHQKKEGEGKHIFIRATQGHFTAPEQALGGMQRCKLQMSLECSMV